MRRYVILALLALLAGCGGDGAASAPPTNTPPLPTTTGTPPIQVGENQPRVVAFLEMSGGMKGITQRLEVWSDGKLIVDGAGGNRGAVLATGQATPEQLAEIEATLGGADFQALKTEYLPANTCCDLITYVVGAPQGAVFRTVTTMDGAEWPPALAAAIQQLQALQSQAGSER